METMRYWAEGNQSRYLYKPYLFPLSSMTKNQMNAFYATIRPVVEESFDEYFTRKKRRNKTPTEEDPITLKSVNCDVTSVNWMLEHHFDIYGLIEKGLAIDATGKDIY